MERVTTFRWIDEDEAPEDDGIVEVGDTVGTLAVEIPEQEKDLHLGKRR